MRPVYTVPQHLEAHHVVRFMAARGTRAVVVVRDLHPVGIVTADDLALRIAGSGLAPSRTPVDAAMSSPPVTIGDWATVEEAITLMHTKEIGHLPIVRAHGDLAALLTLEEALRLRKRGATVLNEFVRASVMMPMVRRDRWKRARYAVRHWIRENQIWFWVALGLAVAMTAAALFMSRFWTSMGDYEHKHYEPKDLSRGQYEQQKEKMKPGTPASTAQ
jgi:predicted transcriptional regulator